MDFADFFQRGSRVGSPRSYQHELAMSPWRETLVIPTGFGKTAAILAAWLWKVAHNDPETPRRLVYCLPMRTLVEQTEKVVKDWRAAAELSLNLEVEVAVLMGGRHEGRGWIVNPERPTILLGTQDILVSAALMRGYGVSRYRWPVDFALLNNDAFWVFDEVQLTGATLSTSGQLEAFRRTFGVGKKCRTLWMSATLDPAWLKTADFVPADKYRPHDLTHADLVQASHLWTAKKSLQRLDVEFANAGKKPAKAYVAALAKHAIDKVKPSKNTIVFVNTVRRAQALFEALQDADCEVVLIHSRFRQVDRGDRMKQLSVDAPVQGRIIVATQALEAGVDVTSTTMITEIAPWSSLVQRFGRCNRIGECGETGSNIFWVDLPDAETNPYSKEDFENARGILEGLRTCGPSDLAAIPPSVPERGAVIRKRDLMDLFDTDPDLSGFDVDVSLYVRDADDTDVRLFWRQVEEGGPPENASVPAREELCPAPIGGAKELLKRRDVSAWRWDGLSKRWRRTGENEVFPGMALWIDCKCGGYDARKGFDPEGRSPVEPVSVADSTEAAPAFDSDAETACNVKVSLVAHSAHVRDQAHRIVEKLRVTDAFDSRETDSLIEAALWHDLGKAHEVFKARCGLANDQIPLAKTPEYDWRKLEPRNRKFFRHELASALAFLAARQWEEEASLAAYLIAAHHGKLRLRICALPKERSAQTGKLFARGVVDGDVVPETALDGIAVPATTLNLDIMQLGDGPCGPSWSARTQKLLRQYGPFRLAWLEALVRIADWRASAAEERASHDDL